MKSLQFTSRKSGGFLILAEGFMIEVNHKPAWFHLLMMRLFFGWRWKE